MLSIVALICLLIAPLVASTDAAKNAHDDDDRSAFFLSKSKDWPRQSAVSGMRPVRD